MNAELIRVAKPEDVERLAELCGELGYSQQSGQLAARLQVILSDPRHAVLVSETEGEGVVALVHVYTDTWLVQGSAAEIGGLVVSRDHRSAGVGARLLKIQRVYRRSLAGPIADPAADSAPPGTEPEPGCP